MPTQHVSIRTYLVVYVLLMLLLGATVIVGSVQLGSFALLATLLVAGCKAILVLVYFMHLRYGQPIMRFFAVAGLLWFALLLGLTLCDVASRM